MILTVAKKPRLLHCIWILIITIITTKVSAHAPPRSIYYGHRVTQREQIPVSVRYSYASGRNRIEETPSCTQLRFAWNLAVKDLYSVGNGNDVNGFNNDIPMLLNNPYYMMLLWGKQQNIMQQQRPHFGKIVVSPTQPPPSVVNIHHRGKGPIKDEVEDENFSSRKSPHIPGYFSDTSIPESGLGAVYGKIIHSPDEAHHRREHLLNEENARRHQSPENGVFGAFPDAVEDSREFLEHTEPINNKNNKQNSIKHQRTSTGSSFSTADEFFKSGIWYNKPVVPSVSFQP